MAGKVHNLQVIKNDSYGSGWFVKCQCGWSDVDFSTEQKARSAYNAHVRASQSRKAAKDK